VTDVFKIHTHAWSYCQAVLTVKQLGFLPNGNKKKESAGAQRNLLVHKETKIKINGMSNECFYLCILAI